MRVTADSKNRMRSGNKDHRLSSGKSKSDGVEVNDEELKFNKGDVISEKFGGRYL